MFRNPFFIGALTIISASALYFSLSVGLSQETNREHQCFTETENGKCSYQKQVEKSDKNTPKDEEQSSSITDDNTIDTKKKSDNSGGNKAPLPDLLTNTETTTIERSGNIAPDQDDAAIANNIANAILDTLVGEITSAEKQQSDDNHQVSVNIRWKSDIDMLRNEIGKAFTYNQTARARPDGFSRVMHTIPQPDEKSDNYDAFSALLELKISLIIQVGEEKKLITIASGYRDKNEQLEFVLLPSKGESRTALFVKGETTPVVLGDFSSDEAKLLRKAVLGIVLQRLDTGRAFRIKLDERTIS